MESVKHIVVKESNFIYETNIPHNICDDVVDFYYNNDTYKPLQGTFGGLREGDNPLDTKDSMDITVPLDYCQYDHRLGNYLKYLDRCLSSYFKKYPRAEIPCHISKKFNIQWYPVGGGYKVWHFERTERPWAIKRHLVWMTYLTDNVDGGTEFLFQDLYVPAKKGKTLIWPAEWCFTHRSKVDINYEKMIITGWVEL